MGYHLIVPRTSPFHSESYDVSQATVTSLGLQTSILIVALPRPRSITSLSLTHIPLLHTSNKQACVSTHNLSTHRLCVTTRNVPGRPNQTDSALQSPQGTAVWSWLLSPALLLSARMRRRMVDTRSCMSPRSLHCILFQSNPANMDTVAVR